MFNLSVYSDKVPMDYEMQTFADHSTKEESLLETTKILNTIALPSLSSKYVELTKGSIKVVWGKRSKINASSSSVYYTAIPSGFDLKERELKSEFDMMQSIAAKLEIKSGNPRYLAIEAKKLVPEKQIEGKYMLKVRQALTDFEKKLCYGQTSLKERIEFGGHFLQGLTSLHLADYTHGDMKPENCLIYQQEGQLILKLADFGKAKELSGKATGVYKGNMRYVCPEGQQSKKGDVYGAALILIRNFEEEYLKNDLSLLTIEQKDLDMKASPNLRGVEKYVVENKAFLSCNEGFSFEIIRRRLKMAAPTFSLSILDKEQQTLAIHAYIEALQAKLMHDERLSPSQTEAFCHLLKGMTVADDRNRFSAAEASTEYAKIFGY